MSNDGLLELSSLGYRRVRPWLGSGSFKPWGR